MVTSYSYQRDFTQGRKLKCYRRDGTDKQEMTFVYSVKYTKISRIETFTDKCSPRESNAALDMIGYMSDSEGEASLKTSSR